MLQSILLQHLIEQGAFAAIQRVADTTVQPPPVNWTLVGQRSYKPHTPSGNSIVIGAARPTPPPGTTPLQPTADGHV